MAIEPTELSITEFAADAAEDAGPIVMINLLKFDGAEGAAKYQEYAAAVVPHLTSVGATVLYAGDVSRRVIGDEGAIEWDSILAVQYPSRTAFLTMIADPEYLKIHHHRAEALETSELIATTSWFPSP
jgi:uncharacterized protein (DUF1330 family)